MIMSNVNTSFFALIFLDLRSAPVFFLSLLPIIFQSVTDL